MSKQPQAQRKIDALSASAAAATSQKLALLADKAVPAIDTLVDETSAQVLPQAALAADVDAAQAAVVDAMPDAMAAVASDVDVAALTDSIATDVIYGQTGGEIVGVSMQTGLLAVGGLLVGTAVFEEVTGDNGKVITGTSGDERLVGTNDNDTFIGSLGEDTYEGGAGTDLLDFSNFTEDLIVSFPDVNRSPSPDVYSYNAPIYSYLDSIENVNTGSGEDYVDASYDGGHVINTNAGEDYINIYSNNNTVNGGSGYDYLDVEIDGTVDLTNIKSIETINLYDGYANDIALTSAQLLNMDNENNSVYIYLDGQDQTVIDYFSNSEDYTLDSTQTDTYVYDYETETYTYNYFSGVSNGENVFVTLQMYTYTPNPV